MGVAADRRNLSMLADFYEFTMMDGYMNKDLGNSTAVFDLFFRRIPDGGGFAIFAGLQQAMDYMDNLSFTREDMEYFKGRGFSQNFLDYLRDFAFCCDVWSVPEGTPIFPNEPVITVRGPLIQAQMLETMLLLSVNFPSLVATKTNRVVRAAQGRPVVEFGARRAQSYDAAILGARAAYIGGCVGTSNTMAERNMGIPASGTMAHSWVQVFDNEYEAFKAYALAHPNDCSLLVDTYNTLKSGVPNAIRVYDEILKPMGIRPKAVRIDSGDLAYLSKGARRMLDDAGYGDVNIMASNSLDEYIVRDLLLQNAAIDAFGVGENLITSKSEPVFGGVYKLVAAENKNGVLLPKIKISETVEKITVPAFKKLYRFFSRENGKALADYVTLRDEVVDDSRDIEIFDPHAVWKRKTVYNYTAKELQVQVFDKGRRCYTSPPLEEVRAFCASQVDTLWEESLRFEYPHRYYVDLSQALWDTQHELLRTMSV